MTKIITTVGISLFTNFQQDEVKNKYGTDYASISIDKVFKNIDKEETRAVDIWNPKYKHFIAHIKESIEDYWFDGEFLNNTNASAEISSILKIVEKKPDKTFEVHLIATDTLMSVLAAELIRDWFSRHKQLAPNISKVLFQRIQPHFNSQKESEFVIKDLRVNQQEEYENGFMNLIQLLNKIIEEGKDILNITGGYKGMVPLMTIIGQLKGVSVKYLFEESNLSKKSKIIALGNLPVNFDWTFGELYLDYITKEGLRSIEEHPNTLELLRGMNIVGRDTCKLTHLGRLFRDYITPLSTSRRGDLGFLVELRLFEQFSMQEHQKITRGKRFWWDVQETSKYYEEPQFDKDNSREIAIEIDLIITKESGVQEWLEVKSWTNTGLKKAKKQLAIRIDFLKAVEITPPDEFTLLLYKLPDTRIDYQSALIREICKLAKDEFNRFNIRYFDIPISGKGLPNIKIISEKEVFIQDLDPVTFMS